MELNPNAINFIPEIYKIKSNDVLNKQLFNNEQLICIDDETNNMYYFNLIDVYNKIIKLNNIKKIDLKQF